MRIVILGCAGGGKTTLAQRLGKITGVPVISLDQIWQPDWKEADVRTFRNLVKQVRAGDCWISDGNFALATFDLRLPRATMVIWIERSRWFCMWHAVARLFKRGEAHRVGKLKQVFSFIFNFERVNRPRIEKARTSHGPDVPVRKLRNNWEMENCLSAYIVEPQ
jgi:adenylate kinase family enzyme